MLPVIKLIDIVIGLYIWALIISAILSWLLAFNVLNSHNRLVYTINDFLYRITEPVLRPIRRFVPLMGGIDLAPLVLILLLYFVRMVLWDDIAPAVM
jgi:YggT family protein